LLVPARYESHLEDFGWHAVIGAGAGIDNKPLRERRDLRGTPAGGQFVVNGVAQTGGHEIDVSPANVANTIFDVGTSGFADTLWARLQLDNGATTGWRQFTVSDPNSSEDFDDGDGVTLTPVTAPQLFFQAVPEH
jgi:hypothetical protein